MKKIILSFIFVIGSIVGFSQSLYEYTDLSNYRVKVGELVLNGQKMRPITPLVNQVLMYDGLRWKNQNEKDLIFAADSANIVKYLGNDRDLDMGANSISVDTVKIDGVPLLLNTFKQGNLGGASNIFYSTGASSQPESGNLNQVIGDNYIKNQNTSPQNANIWINGTAEFDGYIYGRSNTTSWPAENKGIALGWNKSGGDAEVNIYNTFTSFSPGRSFEFSQQTSSTAWSVLMSLYPNGNATFSGGVGAVTFQSTVPTGTAPLVVASTTKVDNLNAELLDGKSSDFFGKYNEETLGNDVDFNSLSYDRGTILTTQPLHVPNYSGQINYPTNNYGQLLTFGGVNGLFPFQLAVDLSSRVLYRIKYNSENLSSFTNTWREFYTSNNANLSTINWNAYGFISHAPTGAAPLVVASTTKVDNLNVEMLDGKHASDFLKYTDKVIQTDTVKVNKDLIITGEIYNEINHLYAMFYDSTIVTTLTKDVWQQVTNTTKTLYSASEQDGITILGDTIVFSKAGGYDVYFEFNNIGIDKKEYHYRILQKNGSTVVRSYNKYASTGIQQVRNEKAYIQVEAGAKVWCEIMSPNPVPGDVTIQGSKVYAMQRYLEK